MRLSSRAADQQCPECGSPLRPCKCQRTAKPKNQRRTKPAREREAEFRRVYHSKRRVAWVGTLPCCACGKQPSGRWPSENHHTWAEGTSRKGPYTAIVPLCRPCHRRYHKVGKLSMLQATVREHGGLWVGYTVNTSAGQYWRDFSQWEDAAAYVQALWLQHTA